ncbi:MAG: hypothetical protein ICV66_08790, partial [Chitinophagaceae bacterium]|nr:hypothetical protein [Chitinophagaceae bacterium]
SGVFVVRVDDVTTTPVMANINEQRKAMQTQVRQTMMYQNPIDALKKAATIRDNRFRFY